MADTETKSDPNPYADPELKKYMKMIAHNNKLRVVILRSFLVGIFTAAGTTIGFAALIVAGAGFLSNLKQVPFLDSFLRNTKFDVLIEDQLNRIQSGSTTGDTVAEAHYADSTYKLNFNYPSTFTSVKQVSADETGKEILMSGTDPLVSVEIYINRPVTITGQSTTIEVDPPLFEQKLNVQIYEDGVTVMDTEYKTAVYTTQFTKDGNTYMFVGYADTTRPKLAREVFIGILGSISFGQ